MNILKSDPRQYYYQNEAVASSLLLRNESNNGQQQVDAFISSLSLSSPVEKIKLAKKPHLQIGQAKQCLRESLILLNQLEERQNELKSNVGTMESAIWKQKSVEIGQLKDEFTKLTAQFENDALVNELQRQVVKRRKKRKSQKRKRLFQQEVKELEIEKRLKLHKDIDNWLMSMKEATECCRMEANKKKDADCVLAEVTKKKSEAKKQLSLVEALVKLRSVRETVAQHRGEKTSIEDRVAFNITTDKLNKIWQDCMKTYNREEQSLRLMLEKNAQDDTQAAHRAKEQTLLEEWQEVLFGPKHLIPTNNPTYWALTAAERDLQTFIAIRKSWDTFLVNDSNDMGSKIPIGWVLPDDKTAVEDEWNQYLQH